MRDVHNPKPSPETNRSKYWNTTPLTKDETVYGRILFIDSQTRMAREDMYRLLDLKQPQSEDEIGTIAYVDSNHVVLARYTPTPFEYAAEYLTLKLVDRFTSFGIERGDFHVQAIDHARNAPNVTTASIQVPLDWNQVRKQFRAQFRSKELPTGDCGWMRVVPITKEVGIRISRIYMQPVPGILRQQNIGGKEIEFSSLDELWKYIADLRKKSKNDAPLDLVLRNGYISDTSQLRIDFKYSNSGTTVETVSVSQLSPYLVLDNGEVVKPMTYDGKQYNDYFVRQDPFEIRADQFDSELGSFSFPPVRASAKSAKLSMDTKPLGGAGIVTFDIPFRAEELKEWSRRE